MPKIPTTFNVSVPLDECPLCVASLSRMDNGVPLHHNSADAGFQNFVTGNDFNKNFL